MHDNFGLCSLFSYNDRQSLLLKRITQAILSSENVIKNQWMQSIVSRPSTFWMHSQINRFRGTKFDYDVAYFCVKTNSRTRRKRNNIIYCPLTSIIKITIRSASGTNKDFVWLKLRGNNRGKHESLWISLSHWSTDESWKIWCSRFIENKRSLNCEFLFNFIFL